MVISPEKVTRYLQDVGICMCFISMCLATTYCFKGYVRNSFKLLKGQNIMRLYSGFNKPFRFTFIFLRLHLFSTFAIRLKFVRFYTTSSFLCFKMVSANPFRIIVCSILFYGKWQHTPVTNAEMWQIDGWDIICMRIQTRVLNLRAVSFLSLDSFPFTFRFCKYLNDSIEENLKGDDRLSFKLIKKICRSHLKRNHRHSVQVWHDTVSAKHR